MRLRYFVLLTLLTASACVRQKAEEAPAPVVGPPLILLTANGRTSLSFVKDTSITIELRTSVNTRSCVLIHPVVDAPQIPTRVKYTISPSDSLYPKVGTSVKVVVNCTSHENKSAEATLLVEHNK